MGMYGVKLSAPAGHSIPSWLKKFGAWLAKQDFPSLGHFELEARKAEWSDETNERLQRDAFSFLRLPDGSELALLKTGAKGPPAVVLLGSEGDASTLATS